MPAPYTQLDSAQVLKQSFDESTDSLRTNATLVAGTVTVDVSADDGDSVKIGNGTGQYAAVNSSGGVRVESIQLFTKPFDAITATYPSATQEVYVSRVGGTGGTAQETVTINYTDATKNFITDVART